MNLGLGPASTADDAIEGIDLSGKTAIATEGYSGLGLKTVRVLSSAGAKFWFRLTIDCDTATDALNGLYCIEIESMDLNDPSSLDTVAEQLIASMRPLHILVDSAGTMAVPLERDSPGYEVHLSTNHLRHFQLTPWLWPARGVLCTGSVGFLMAPSLLAGSIRRF